MKKTVLLLVLQVLKDMLVFDMDDFDRSHIERAIELLEQTLQ
jgi:hypothetical protein